ncbi:hypothetical protein [Paraburkholderia strydomiana]|uniref:hypothetical protein n=1 Tax=Paraburkholderia strydomiana TaxID=1245417 RepID=UPI001BE9CA94|nr:hypothetical protein [Paraburkholderia strydomiana]MBT2790423.1 hypothetical protein [Paraburkholderia strydomiana]
MKPRATIAHEQHRLKRPAALADAEIVHLETVVRYFVNNSRAGDATEYLDLSYWLVRVEGIGEHFRLVSSAATTHLVANDACGRGTVKTGGVSAQVLGV